MFLSSSAQIEGSLVLPHAPCFAILHYKGNRASSKPSLEDTSTVFQAVVEGDKPL